MRWLKLHKNDILARRFSSDAKIYKSHPNPPKVRLIAPFCDEIDNIDGKNYVFSTKFAIFAS